MQNDWRWCSVWMWFYHSFLGGSLLCKWHAYTLIRVSRRNFITCFLLLCSCIFVSNKACWSWSCKFELNPCSEDNEKPRIQVGVQYPYWTWDTENFSVPMFFQSRHNCRLWVFYLGLNDILVFDNPNNANYIMDLYARASYYTRSNAHSMFL